MDTEVSLDEYDHDEAGRLLAGGVRPGGRGELCGLPRSSGDPGADPTLPIWAQLQSELEDLKENGTGTGGGVDFETGETLELENGVLSVNTTDAVEAGNNLPITSAGVFATVGNIEALLKTI